MTRRRRPGFTLLEVIMVATIIGALSVVAVPKYRDINRRAIAAQVLSDVDLVRTGVYAFYSDSGYFPKESGSGVTPTNLSAYLPLKFSLQKASWTLDYENWTLVKTQPQYLNTGILIGVSVTTTDPLVGAAAMGMFGNSPSYTMGTKHTFMIAGM